MAPNSLPLPFPFPLLLYESIMFICYYQSSIWISFSQGCVLPEQKCVRSELLIGDSFGEKKKRQSQFLWLKWSKFTNKIRSFACRSSTTMYNYFFYIKTKLNLIINTNIASDMKRTHSLQQQQQLRPPSSDSNRSRFLTDFVVCCWKIITIYQ